MSKNRIEMWMLGLVVSILLTFSEVKEPLAAISRDWPPQVVGGESSIGIEEYAQKEDYTGWLHVTVRVKDVAGNLLEGIYVVLRKADGSGNAGHGPSINGEKNYQTDENGELMFRIFPSPVRYNVLVPKQGKWEEKEEGSYTIEEDFQTIEVILEEKKEDQGGGNNGGNHGNNNGDNVENNHGDVVEESQKSEESQEQEQEEESTADSTNSNRDEESSLETDVPKFEEIILPKEPSESGGLEVTLPGPDKEMGTDDDIIVIPDLDKNQENNSSIDPDGSVKLPDGGIIIFETYPDKGDVMIKVPSGTKVEEDGRIHLPEGGNKELILPGKDAALKTKDDVWVHPFKGGNGTDNSIINRDGSVLLVNGGKVTYKEDGTEVEVPGGTVVLADGTIIYPTSVALGRIPVAECWVHWLVILGCLCTVGGGLWRLKQLEKYLDIKSEKEKEDGSGEAE